MDRPAKSYSGSLSIMTALVGSSVTPSYLSALLCFRPIRLHFLLCRLRRRTNEQLMILWRVRKTAEKVKATEAADDDRAERASEHTTPSGLSRVSGEPPTSWRAANLASDSAH